MNVTRQIEFKLKTLNDRIPKNPKGQSLSASIVRAAGNGVRHEVAELYCRFERLKLFSATVVQNVQQRAEKQTNMINELLQQIKADAVSRVDEAVALYNKIDSDQRRWIAKHDWHNYDDGVNTKTFQVSVSKTDELPKLSKSHANPPKKKSKTSTSTATATAAMMPRIIRRATRSTKALNLRQRASDVLDKINKFCEEANVSMIKPNTGLPTREYMEWAQSEVDLNKNAKTKYTSTKQVMLNIADIFEERSK